MKTTEKEIWKLFKMNRNNFNMFDLKAGRILMKIFEQGVEQGRKEMRKEIKDKL